MIVSTTMVLLILVEVTWPILVLRRLACGVFVVSAIYFFLVLPAGLAFLAFAAGLAFAAFFGATSVSDADASAGAASCVGCTIFSCFSRMMVWIRATSLRSPRILLRLSVCPIFSWNFSRKS